LTKREVNHQYNGTPEKKMVKTQATWCHN